MPNSILLKQYFTIHYRKGIKGQKEFVIPTERSDEGSQNMDMLSFLYWFANR